VANSGHAPWREGHRCRKVRAVGLEHHRDPPLQRSRQRDRIACPYHVVHRAVEAHGCAQIEPPLANRACRRDVARYLYAADCLVVPNTDAPLNRYGRTVLPMKLFAYMAAGRPILAPRLPDIEEVLTDDRTAVLVEPGDSVAAAAALRSLLAEPARAERLASAAREAARQFTWSARAIKITAAISRWIGSE
jgi:glycosyltransferase involved in cell wall biosynthesis